MKNNLIYLSVIVACVLFSSCKKDDEMLTETIYGPWSTGVGWITNGSEWHTYVFSKPDKCHYKKEEADNTTVYTEDSLTFYISDKTLYIYRNDGSQFRAPASIEKLSGGRLQLKYPTGELLKFKRP